MSANRKKFCPECGVKQPYNKDGRRVWCLECGNRIMRKYFYRHHNVSSVWFNDMKAGQCIVVESKRTMQVKTHEGKHLIAAEHLTGAELNLINRTQKEVEAWYELRKEDVEGDLYKWASKKVMYKGLHLNTLKKNFDQTVHCFDLRSAYPALMHREGIISDGIWKEVSDVPKHKRNWICGSIASTKSLTTYENGIEVSYELKTKPTKIVWEYVVSRIDFLMRKLFSEFKSFYNYNYFSLAYYVDCLFVLCDSPKLMDSFIQEFSEIIFKEGFSYGYKQLILKDFDLFSKKITLANSEGKLIKYSMTDNGYYHPSKILEGV